MNLQDCIAFAKENPLASLSTMDGDQPRVRTLLMDWADETGFYFTVASPKDVSKQLHCNSKVEVCFFNHAANLMEAKQMRLTGSVEFIEDAAANKRAVQNRAPLAPMVQQTVGVDLNPLLEVVRIPHGEAHFWTIPDLLREHELERVKF